jgi:hypothetical protein
MFGTITKQEIDANTQARISAPLAHFLDFRDFCSNIHLNYEFLTAAGHAIPELTRIDSFTRFIEAFTQFDSYLTTWTTSNALGSRTLGFLTKFLLEQYGDMPTENAPCVLCWQIWQRQGQGKRPRQGPGQRHTRNQTHQRPCQHRNVPVIICFVFFGPQTSNIEHNPGPHSRTEPRKTLPLLLVPRMEFFPSRQRV